MSSKLTVDPAPMRGKRAPDRGRSKTMKRLGIAVAVVAGVGLVLGGSVVFAWMIDETHFDRPSPAFDELQSQVEMLPGVDGVEKERWVEAPTFSDPTSWMSVTVDQGGLPGLLQAACTTDYPDAVMWTIIVQTPSSAEVTLGTETQGTAAAADASCADFGFDPVGLVDELDRVMPGQAIQPSVWEAGTLALVALEMQLPNGYEHLLPLVESADDLLAAGGRGQIDSVEINSANLGVTVHPGESAGYTALLTALAVDHGVTSFWADGGGTPVNGVEKVQVVAPEQEWDDVEALIRSSSLHVADLDVRFIEQ